MFSWRKIGQLTATFPFLLQTKLLQIRSNLFVFLRTMVRANWHTVSRKNPSNWKLLFRRTKKLLFTFSSLFARLMLFINAEAELLARGRVIVFKLTDYFFRLLPLSLFKSQLGECVLEHLLMCVCTTSPRLRITNCFCCTLSA